MVAYWPMSSAHCTPSYRHSVSVAAVVTDDQDRVLLVCRADNREWEPPGGVVERDEDILTALVREVREEAGVTVSPGRLTGVYKNMAFGIVALVFRCTVAAGQLTPGIEAIEARWADPDQLGEMVGERLRVRIEDALADQSNVMIRAYSPSSTPAP